MSSQFYIIGSGISGLVLAYELAKKGNSVRIFESLTYVEVLHVQKALVSKLRLWSSFISYK